MWGARRLVVMRHARALPYAADDAGRDLTARGRADAEEAGRYLARHGVRPDIALVSSALRARSTWEEVGRTWAGGEPGGRAVEVRVEPSFYTATPDIVLEELRLLGPEVDTALYLGHNPTAAFVTHLLHDGEGEAEALEGLLSGFPPCAVAVLETAGDWSELGEGCARLLHFHVGHAGQAG